jgi:hypothetical protein
VTTANVALADWEDAIPPVPILFWRDQWVSSEVADPAERSFVPGNLLPHSVVYPVWRVGEHSLRKPLVVSIEHDEEQVIVSSETLRIWGVGATKFEALADFGRTFVELLENYAGTPEPEMTEGAIRYLRQLRSFLSEHR